jgi:hypothetical protein
MTLDVNWTNPYARREGSWLKGNLHAHTAPGSPCGNLPLEKTLELYNRNGYRFLAISDHMVLSETSNEYGMTLIPGAEWNSGRGEHTGILSADKSLFRQALTLENHEQLLEFLSKTDALVILNHPNWEAISHYRREQLAEKRFFDGIEIYNAVIERLTGYAISTDKWDYLLAQNRRVLGFASDDSHVEADIGRAWICVRSANSTARALLDAIRQGNFYCSSGVAFSDIRRDGNVVTVETENAEEIWAIASGGRRMASTNRPSMQFDMSSLDQGYVRFAAYGYGSSMGWTQPFFVE